MSLEGFESLSVTQEFYSREGPGEPSRTPRLFVANGPAGGRSFELGQDERCIGRSERRSICLPSREISKKHCTVGCDGEGRFYVRDEASTNGTRVNGRKIEARVHVSLVHGDKIAVCHTVMIFVDPRQSFAAADLSDIEVDGESVSQEVEAALGSFTEITRIRKKRLEKA